MCGSGDLWGSLASSLMSLDVAFYIVLCCAPSGLKLEFTENVGIVFTLIKTYAL